MVIVDDSLVSAPITIFIHVSLLNLIYFSYGFAKAIVKNIVGFVGIIVILDCYLIQF